MYVFININAVQAHPYITMFKNANLVKISSVQLDDKITCFNQRRI